jgi:hypothetical protein
VRSARPTLFWRLEGVVVCVCVCVASKSAHVVLRLGSRFEGAGLRRLKEHAQQRLPSLVSLGRHEWRHRRRQHRTRRVAKPRRAQGDQQLVGERADAGVCPRRGGAYSERPMQGRPQRQRR